MTVKRPVFFVFFSFPSQNVVWFLICNYVELCRVLSHRSPNINISNRGIPAYIISILKDGKQQ